MNYEKIEIESLQDFFRDLHRKPGLSSRIRYLASIEACIALGEDHLLRLIFELALDDGVMLDEIHEVMLQACIFCGFPRTINSFAVLRRYLREQEKTLNGYKHKVDDRSPAEMESMGQDLFRTIYKYNHNAVIESLKEGHPELPKWIMSDLYGKVLTRPMLDSKTRELAAVAGLTVSEVFPQLLSHIKGGLNLGADPGEVKEVILQMESYTSKDTVRRALRILNLGTRIEKVPIQPPITEAS